MPADSERGGQRLPLPHTWRPFGARIAAYVGGVGLLVVCAVCWLAFDQEIRDQFSIYDKIAMVLVGSIAFAAWWALVRSRVVAEDARLVVVNGFRRHVYDYAQIVSVHLSHGAPWAVLDLSDGTSMSVLAIQGSDGERAAVAVRHIRRLLR